MRRIFTALFLVAALSASAQISEYQHPCTIMGQETIAVSKGESFTPEVGSLIIHDVDDASDNHFAIDLLKGDNYKVSKGRIIPDANFEGTLKVNIRLTDGKFKSDDYQLMVAVGNAQVEPDRVIYVATSGSDSANGSINTPVATLEHAKMMARQSSAKGESVTVYFRGGDYYMDKTVKFTAEDSGSEAAPIIYAAYPGEEVRLTGSVAIPYSKFEKAMPKQISRIKDENVKPRIKVVDLKAMGINSYGEHGHLGYGFNADPTPAARLFVDGAAMHLSRYPNVGNIDDISWAEGLNKFKSESGIIFSWENTGDIWIDGSLSKAWEWQKNRIETIEADSTVTTSFNYYSDIATHEVKMFYYNIFEELDYPEEYFLDKENGLLYVYFPSCVGDDSDIRFSQSEANFIELEGANYLTFKDLAFEGTRESAIKTTKESSNNTFLGCEIYSCSKDGISLNGYNNRVENCLIHNIGANGVSMRGGNSKTLAPARNIVENCKIHDFSQERRVYNPGISIFDIGQVARHNEIYNGPHMAVRISGTNHIFEYCDIHDAPHEYSDMLALYMCTGGNFFDRGTIIRRNKFHNVSGTWKQSAGVYLDNETNGIIVEENYFYDNEAQENGWSMMVHGGSDNIVRRNVFVDCSFPFCISHRLNGYAHDWLERILTRWSEQAQAGINKEWLKAYPEITHLFDDGEKAHKRNSYTYNIKKDKEGRIINYWNIQTPNTNAFVDNLVYNSDPEQFRMSKTNANGSVENRGFYVVNNFRLKNGKREDNLIHSNNHHVTEEPGFVDYRGHDLRVKVGSPITEALPHTANDYYQKIGLKK